MRITVFGSKELQAVLLAVKTLDRDTRKQIRKHTQTMAAPEWQKAMAEQATTRLEHRVLVSTARVRVSDQNVTLTAATVGRALSGGLSIKDQWHAVEYGAADTEVTYQARNRQGTTYNVTRNTRAQLKVRKKAGYVVGPAAAAIIPRIASLWVQTTARTIYDKLEGKG
jgi:hypothetical protein